MTAEQSYNTVVIGAGSGGLTVAIGLAALGKRVALIEGHWVGGDCTNVGCIPSKTLIHLAAEIDAVPSAAAGVLAEVQRKRNHLRDEEHHLIQNTPHLDYITGWASFVGPRCLAVRGENDTSTINAANIVIATGSRPRTIPIASLPADRLLTNDSVFEQADAPAHLAIIGSGPIALEMAFAFRKLGSRVTVITKDQRVLSTGPASASKVLDAALIEADIELRYGTTPTAYDASTQTLTLRNAHATAGLEGVDKVLMAIGRVRNIDRIGLEHTGVKWSEGGIVVNNYCATNVPGIFAIGDATPDSRWTHSANAQGRRVVQKIAFPWLPAFSPPPLYPNATFSDPEVANIGLMPDDIAQRFHPALIKTLRFDLPATDKGYTESLKHGFIEVHAVRLTGRILGATIVGPRASEMISFFTLAITAKVSLYRIYRLVYPYPTLSGAIQKVADAFMRETLPHIPAELAAFVRYGAASLALRLPGRGSMNRQDSKGAKSF